MKKLFVFIYLVVTFYSCQEGDPERMVSGDAPTFSMISPDQTGIFFKNEVFEDAARQIYHYDYFYNGGGVALGDINNDGLTDIFFAGNDVKSRLYLNKGDMQFEDITESAGIKGGQWATGVSFTDINEDGWLDIYVCHSGPYNDSEQLRNKLYVNNGDNTFSERASQYGVDDDSYSTQAVFFDMDKDGDLDLFVLNHSWINYGNSIQELEEKLFNVAPEVQRRSSNTLYRNEGNGKFTDITQESGLYGLGFGLGVAVTDLNEDGLLDIYVANDYYKPDFFFLNNGGGRFTESLNSISSHTSFYSMGCDAADFNNDGLVDLGIVDMTPSDHFRNKTLMESMDVERFRYLTKEKKYLPQYMFNTLHLNREGGKFSEIGLMSGVSQTDWSWAFLFGDWDNDGWKDICITNGYKRDTKDQDWALELNQRYKAEGKSPEVYFDHLQNAASNPVVNYIYRNMGGDENGHPFYFKDVSEKWGFDQPSFSQGLAYGDLDNDGDLDLVINNLDREAFIYRNNTQEKGGGNFFQLSLTDDRLSRVLHSRVTVKTPEGKQYAEYSFVRGYQSSMEHRLHFGLGSADHIESVEIEWPDGSFTRIEDPAINRHLIVPRSKMEGGTKPSTGVSPLFMDISGQARGLNFIHVENDFDDFEKEVLLPQKMSTLGPCLAVGDVNRDGLTDFYVGGAKGQSGSIFFQTAQQGPVRSANPVFFEDRKFEDLGAIFIDLDSDGDLDLYVCSGGGGDVSSDPTLLQDRLYINDGLGTFKRNTSSSPAIRSSTDHVSAMDWDKDGDADLFVGGRNIPGEYPRSADSYLLENRNGILVDVTSEKAPVLKQFGLITSSVWMDVDNDGLVDLITAGEWMPLSVLLQKNGRFVPDTTDRGFHQKGWWYSLGMADLDKDGDLDIVAGNLGLNNKFHASEEKPFHVFSNDFDDNGTLDIVLSKHYKDGLAPVRGKECSSEQMPFLKEKFPSYAQFASAYLPEIYGQDKLEEAIHYEVDQFASGYYENDGNGNFIWHPLPAEAQMGPIMDLILFDFDSDGNMDIALAGGIHNTEVETPAYDANKGLILKGDGTGKFKPLSVRESGFYAPGNVKETALFFLAGNRPAILVANNNGPVQIFAWTR